jgi:hypothetical protein
MGCQVSWRRSIRSRKAPPINLASSFRTAERPCPKQAQRCWMRPSKRGQPLRRPSTSLEAPSNLMFHRRDHARRDSQIGAQEKIERWRVGTSEERSLSSTGLESIDRGDGRCALLPLPWQKPASSKPVSCRGLSAEAFAIWSASWKRAASLIVLAANIKDAAMPGPP